MGVLYRVCSLSNIGVTAVTIELKSLTFILVKLWKPAGSSFAIFFNRLYDSALGCMMYIYLFYIQIIYIAYNIYICVVDSSDISSVEIVPLARYMI